MVGDRAFWGQKVVNDAAYLVEHHSELGIFATVLTVSAALFRKNFEQFASQVLPAVRDAGPR